MYFEVSKVTSIPPLAPASTTTESGFVVIQSQKDLMAKISNGAVPLFLKEIWPTIVVSRLTSSKSIPFFSEAFALWLIFAYMEQKQRGSQENRIPIFGFIE
jgi:hypothetical protein